MKRVVRWLAEIMDRQPDLLKALVLVCLVINGIKGLYALLSLLMWSIVYLAVKAI